MRQSDFIIADVLYYTIMIGALIIVILLIIIFAAVTVSVL